MDSIEQIQEITPKNSVVPVYMVSMTPDEQKYAENLAQEQVQNMLEEEKKLATRKSAISKLKKLGLTEEEILALIG